MRIGDRIQMTKAGESLARNRKLLPSAGEVLDRCSYKGSVYQVYVQRDRGGCEWWPESCWEPAHDRNEATA